MPTRIQRKRTKGWKMPEGAVYVGRPTRFGNPFRVGGYFIIGKSHDGNGMKWLESTHADSRFTLITSNVEAVEWYRRLLEEWPLKDIETLRGKDLACFCPLVDKDGNKVPCHADELLKIANS